MSNWVILISIIDMGKALWGFPSTKFSHVARFCSGSLFVLHFILLQWSTLHIKWNLHIYLYPWYIFSMNSLGPLQLTFFISFCIIIQYPPAYWTSADIINHLPHLCTHKPWWLFSREKHHRCHLYLWPDNITHGIYVAKIRATTTCVLQWQSLNISSHHIEFGYILILCKQLKLSTLGMTSSLQGS